jgi:uncharacterized protein
MAIVQQIPVDEAVLDAFCKQWKIVRLESFDPSYAVVDADLHLLDTLAPDANWSLFDRVRVERELGELLNRSVDLVSRRAIETNRNVWNRSGILDSARLMYAAA